MKWVALIFVIFPLLPNALAWSFTYPNTILKPEREKRVEENLFRTYHEEIRGIERKIKLGPESNKSLKVLSKEIRQRNQNFLRELNLDRGIPVVPLGQIQNVLNSIHTHPVVSEAMVAKYDHDKFRIGFCFGRAAFAHLELLRRGVDPNSIAKVFAIGTFLLPNSKWDFHVATIARGSDKEWFAIDTVTSKKALPVSHWMKKVEKLDKNPAHPTIRFYFSDAVKFLPSEGRYSQETLFVPYFNDYFKDLAQWFDEHPL